MTCYGVHITVCMALQFLFCTLSAWIEPSLHWLDFFFEIFLRRLVSVLFLLRCTAHVIARGWCVIRARVLTNDVQQPVRSAPSLPSVFPARKSKRLVPVTLKAKLKRHIPREIRKYLVAVSDAIHVSLYGARLVEERRDRPGSFRSFQVSTLPLKNSYYTLLFLLETQWGRLL